MINSEDFFTDHPPERLIGVETECNLQTRNDHSSYEYISGQTIRRAGYGEVHGFLNNGMQIYPDVDHLEVDTPECLGPAQAAAADGAALDVIVSVVNSSKLPHGRLHAHTGTIIGNRERTSGRHENYMIPRSIVSSELFDSVLASFLTTAVFKMSGSLKDGVRLSQKVKGIGDPPITRKVERRTAHGNKPMAMIPQVRSDNDTIGWQEWSRVEVRMADTLYSQTARYLGFAATSLVLRLIEHQDKIDLKPLVDFSFKEHATAVRHFSNDLSLSKTAEATNGSFISAVDYQEALASYSARLAEEIQLPADEEAAIPLWLEICDRLRAADLTKGEYEGLLTLLDFAPRHRYLTTRFSPDDLTSQNPDAVEANLTWDRILPAGGGMTYWRNFPSEYVDPAAQADLIYNPPETRAHVRAELINKYGDKLDYINWAWFKLKGSDTKPQLIGNPYGPYDS